MTVSQPAYPAIPIDVMADLSGILFKRRVSPEGTVSYPWFSPNVEIILGYRPEEMTVGANGVLNVVHWADRSNHALGIGGSAVNLTRLQERFRVVTAGGETRWFHGSSQPRRLADGTVEWDGAWLDVTTWMRAETEHQTLMDHAEDSIMTIDGEWGIGYMNAAAEKLFGYTLPEVEHHCPCGLFADEAGRQLAEFSAECRPENFLKYFPTGASEAIGRRQDGSTFPFEMTVSEVRRDGRLLLIVIGRDITRRRVTELLLEETRRSLRSIAANIPGAVFQHVMEPDGHSFFPYLSEGARELFGIDPLDLAEDGAPLFSALVDEDRRRVIEKRQTSARTMEPFRDVGRIRRPDGSIVWVRCHARPRRHDAAVVWDGVLLDVTAEVEERIKAEAALRESEERLRLAFSAAAFGIAVVTVDGLVETCNPALEAIAHRSGSPLAGSSAFAYLPPDGLPAADALPPPGEPFHALVKPVHPDCAGHHWRVTATPFAASAGAATQSLLVFVEDVTEIIRAEQERAQWELAMQESHKLEALGRLAGGVAHELNNMLGPILMGAEMIARTTSLDGRNVERLQRIIDAAKMGREIVRNVLAYCRNEQKVLDTVNIVEVFAQFASLAASILPPTVRVEKACPLAEAEVKADAGQLHQIFLNLANNARDAMGGHGTLSLALDVLLPGRTTPMGELDPTLSYVQITFKDTGCGMSKATAAKIFDPFFTTKPVGQGTGLGLSVVQGIVKTMKGAIVVDSEPGVGTTFTVLLPLAAEAA